MPRSYNPEDAAKLVEVAKEVNAAAGAKVEELDERLMMKLAYVSAGNCSPMQAVIGSISAQEVIKVRSIVMPQYLLNLFFVCRLVAASSVQFVSTSISMHWSVFLRMVRICLQRLRLLLEHAMMDRSPSLELTSRKRWRRTKSFLSVYYPSSKCQDILVYSGWSRCYWL